MAPRPACPSAEISCACSAGDSPDWARIGACVRGPLLTVAAVVVLDVLRRHDVGLISPFPVLILDGGLFGLHRRPPARPRERGGEPAVRAPLFRRAGAAAALFRRAGARASSRSAASTLLAGLLASRLHDRVRQAEVARALPRGRRGAVAAVLVHRAGVAHPELRAPVRRDLPRPLPAARAHAGGLVRHPRGRARMARSGSSPAPIATPRASSWSGRSRSTARARCRSPPRRWRPRWSKSPRRCSATSASDAEALKLYRALAPKAVLRLPLRARDRTVGFLTLAMASDSGRRFAPADVAPGRGAGAGTRAWPSTTCASGRTCRRPTAAPGWSSTRIPSRCGSSTSTRWRSWRSTRPRCTTTAGPARSSGR